MKIDNNRPTILVTASFLLCSIGASIGQKLGHYNVDPGSITVSGISSGAAMATQFHFAHSSEVKGVGLFAGVPYLCANGGGIGLANSCMAMPSTINEEVLITEANNLAASGQIDATSNINGHPVYIFHGEKDSTVHPPSGQTIQRMYEHYGANIQTEFTVQAEHCQPTNNYGGSCGSSAASTHYISNCNYHGAFEMLNYLYGGGLNRPSGSEALPGDFLEFDQSEFFYISPPSFSSMGLKGYVYVPLACKNGAQCRFHIAFHGCSQSKEILGDIFATKTGYLEVAELNNIIVLFPQTIAVLANPNSCWDWWGYVNAFYPTKEGNQILAVQRMLARVVNG